MLARGLEPPRVSPYGPEPHASADSATRAKAVRAYMCGHQATCKVKYSALTLDESEERLVESARALLPGAHLQLVRFADLANGTQKVGVIRNNNIVILRGLLWYLFPRF